MEPFPLVLIVVGLAFVASEFQSKELQEQEQELQGFQDSLIEETSDDSNARHGYHCYTVSFKRTNKPYYTLAVL